MFIIIEIEMREPFYQARYYLNVCYAVQIILGLIILVLACFYQHALRKFLTTASCQLLFGMLLSTYILGFQVIITHSCSYLLWKRLWRKKYSKNVKTIITIWQFFCFMILLTGFCTLWSLHNSIEPLINATEMSLWSGIHNYISNAEWKALWDNVQNEMQCCGIDGYEDWMVASWLPANECHVGHAHGGILAPYACCKSSCSGCYERHMVTCGKYLPFWHIYEINTMGCLRSFSKLLRKSVFWLVAFMLIALKLNFLMFLLTKYIVNRQNECIEISYQDEQLSAKLLKTVKLSSRQKTPKCYCDSCVEERRMEQEKSNMIRTFDDLQECDCEACRDIRIFSP